MTKKHFVALADAIREHNEHSFDKSAFTLEQLRTLADFCHEQNPGFNRDRWLRYIAGECGPNGGEIK